MSNCMGLKVQFDTVVNYMVCGLQYLGKMPGNSSYVDVDHFDELHFDELHFDVNLEVAKKA